MDKIRWDFHFVNWTLYQDSGGLWVAFSSTSEVCHTPSKKEMESWLASRGLTIAIVEKLFQEVEEKGEAAVSVPQLHEPPQP
jgi:hypothetical protein